jgi:hypothetical protein
MEEEVEGTFETPVILIISGYEKLGGGGEGSKFLRMPAICITSDLVTSRKNNKVPPKRR